MRFDDVSPSEMRTLRGVAPQDVDRLLSGRIPAAGVELDDLASFFRGLGEAFPQPQVEALEAKHVAAMMGAATEISATQALAPATSQPQQSEPARYLFALRRKVAAASAAAVTAFSGMAVAGVLPPPIQRAVADTAGHIGIDLPGRSGSDESSDTADTPPLSPSSFEERLTEPREDGAGRDRRSNQGGSGTNDSQGGSERGRGGAGAPGTDDAEAADEARDRDEDAAEDVEEAEDEAADEARDRDEDAAEEAEDREEEAADSEEESADEGRDPDEDAADETDDEEQGSADQDADRNEDAADEFEDASEEPEILD